MLTDWPTGDSSWFVFSPSLPTVSCLSGHTSRVSRSPALRPRSAASTAAGARGSLRARWDHVTAKQHGDQHRVWNSPDAAFTCSRSHGRFSPSSLYIHWNKLGYWHGSETAGGRPVKPLQPGWANPLEQKGVNCPASGHLFTEAQRIISLPPAQIFPSGCRYDSQLCLLDFGVSVEPRLSHEIPILFVKSKFPGIHPCLLFFSPSRSRLTQIKPNVVGPNSQMTACLITSPLWVSKLL